MTSGITVLLVDNEPSFADLAAEMLERVDDRLAVETATSADAATDRVDDLGVDCVVSDYDMPEATGLDLLERVRRRDANLPFILFTGKGSEEIASDAIAAGVTGYFQKKPGREQYALLANQITNAVSQYRTETRLREHERRYERTLTVLHETTRDLMRAGTKTEIYRATVDTADDILDVPVVSAYAFEPADGFLSHVASTDRTYERLDPEETIERGDGLVWAAFSDGETAYYEDVRTETDGEVAETLVRSEVIVPLGTHGVLVAGTETVDGFDETMVDLLQILAANTEAALDRAEREALLREHDRTLTRQNEELTRLDHTNAIVRDITRGVTQASTRAEIEETVCDRLADTDRYLAAWIAPADDPASPTAWAGVDAPYVDRVREDGPGAPEAELVRDAAETNSIGLVRAVLDDPAWERRRTAALTYGFQTAVSVPLVAGERTYGALVVYASQADGVSEGEREVLGELGETIGHAIRSAERTRSLVTDDRLELELVCRDEHLLLNRFSTALDRPVSVEGIIHRPEGTVQYFLRIENPPDDRMADLGERWSAVETVSTVSSDDESALFEVTVTATRFVDVLREFDARVDGATSADGEATVEVTVAGHADPRNLIEALREDYPNVELAAKRETTRSVPTGRLDDRLSERSTAKQFQALQAAHYGGFFEWPRETTGEDLAAALSISAPTYHYHLRAAERTLAELVFDDPSS